MTAHPRWSFNISQALCNGTRDFSRGSCSIFPIHRCAGPRPVLNGSAQPARNGVFLYVAYDPLFLSPVPYAVLEIVFCPERRPACREQAISLTRTGALNTGDTTRQTFRRPKQQVQVVWHQNPGAQLESPLDLPSVQYPGYRVGRWRKHREAGLLPGMLALPRSREWLPG